MANQKQNQNKNPNNASSPRSQTKNPTPATPVKPVTTSAADSGSSRKLTPKQQAMQRRQAIRRRNRIIVFSMIAVVVVIVVGLVLIIVNQPTKFDSLPAATVADNAIPLDPGLTPVDERFVKGASTAKVTLTEYGDFQCPGCQVFFSSDEKTLMDQYVKTGKVKFNFMVFPFLDNGHPAQESHVAAEAAYCAADQKRFWDFHDALYMNQLPENSGKLTPDRMKQLAAQLNLNKDTFNKCLDDHKYKSAVADAYTQGQAKGVTSTPTFFINGQMLTASDPTLRPSLDEIKTALDKALADAK